MTTKVVSHTQQAARTQRVARVSVTEHSYSELLRIQQNHFATLMSNDGKAPLFTTSVKNLFDIFLTNLPKDQRQHHTCTACRKFTETFGSLVFINDDGMLVPAMWTTENVPSIYLPAIQAMVKAIRSARVTGVFLSSKSVWGQPITGAWHHFSVTPPRATIFNNLVLTPEQVMAEKQEDYKNICRALSEFSYACVAKALQVLKTDSLYRGEKVFGPAEWLHALQERRQATSGAARTNLTWLAVATAPAGFCHPRSSMIGTLLEDIAAGLPFKDVAAKFKAKMHPLLYQRPQAAPSTGNALRAEAIVAKMGIANSLKRRYARLDEVEALWAPVKLKCKSRTGVFGHLATKDTQPQQKALKVPSITITWEKFRRTVLPYAESIEFYVPFVGNFTALVTASDMDAPPVIQWDSVERRNPVNWYVYNNGSPAPQWGLQPGRFHRVSAVTLKPSMWGNEEGFPHQGKAVIFILDGARDSRNASLCLFPEVLKSELHEIRSTIEAFSKEGRLTGMEEASACGIVLDAGSNWDARFRVISKGTTTEYRLDRWD